MKRKPKPVIFIQPLDPYRHDLFVVAGATKADLLRFCKKAKVIKECVEVIKEDADKMFSTIESTQLALFFWAKKKHHIFFMLFLRPYKDVWEYWETLIHELAHVVQKLASEKMMEGEDEARAYLHEFLFRSVRRKLQGLEKL